MSTPDLSSSLVSAEPMSVELNSNTSIPEVGTEVTQYTMRVHWTWPPGFGTEWTRLRLVRTIGSPAMRTEEGATLFEVNQNNYSPDDYGDAVFEDQQPPPDRWVYYTVFILTPARIWMRAGEVTELGIGNHGQAYGLPSLMPGVSVSADQGILGTPDPDYTLVEFLQGPALFMDRVLSLGESVQNFWDPVEVPPQMLGPLLNTLGYRLDGTNAPIGIGRLRQIAAALLDRPAGTMEYIERFVRAATGYDAEVVISNNLMLNTNDSSFESGDIEGSAWAPIEALSYAALPTLFRSYASIVAQRTSYTDLKSNAGGVTSASVMEVRDYVDYPSPSPTLPPTVLRDHFLYLNAAAVIRAGATDPVRLGIPIQRWQVARGGFYAFSYASGVMISLQFDLYGIHGEFVRTIVLVPPTPLTTDWTFYSTPFDAPISINRGAPIEDLMTDIGDWEVTFPGYNEVNTYVTVLEGIQLTWKALPNPGNPTALFAIPVTAVSQDIVNAKMKVNAAPDAALWRMTLLYTNATGTYGSFYTGWVTPDGTPQSVSAEWNLPANVDDVWQGIEVQRPPVNTTTYNRVRNDYQTYDELKADVLTYDTLRNLPPGAGWQGSFPVRNSYSEVAAEFASYDSLPFTFSTYDGLKNWDPPVRFPNGAGTHTLLEASTQIGAADDRLTYYGVPVLMTTGTASVDLIVVDDG